MPEKNHHELMAESRECQLGVVLDPNHIASSMRDMETEAWRLTKEVRRYLAIFAIDDTAAETNEYRDDDEDNFEDSPYESLPAQLASRIARGEVSDDPRVRVFGRSELARKLRAATVEASRLKELHTTVQQRIELTELVKPLEGRDGYEELWRTPEGYVIVQFVFDEICSESQRGWIPVFFASNEAGERQASDGVKGERFRHRNQLHRQLAAVKYEDLMPNS